jgi:hypothetical protein
MVSSRDRSDRVHRGYPQQLPQDPESERPPSTGALLISFAILGGPFAGIFGWIFDAKCDFVSALVTIAYIWTWIAGVLVCLAVIRECQPFFLRFMRSLPPERRFGGGVTVHKSVEFFYGAVWIVVLICWLIGIGIVTSHFGAVCIRAD